MLVMRRREPGYPRLFRSPLPWLVGPSAILGCLYLFSSLSLKTQLFFLCWNVLGLVYYLTRKLRENRSKAMTMP